MHLTITGNTYAVRSYLATNGFSWNGRRWEKAIAAEQVTAIRNPETRDDTLRSLSARVKGCRTYLATAASVLCVYESPTAPAENVGPSKPVRDVYAHDAAGRYCAGTRIAGSAADDMA